MDDGSLAGAAARAVLAEVLAPTQEVLRQHRVPARLSWRTREDVYAYVTAALQGDLGHGTLRRATDQQLRQRVLPLLLDARERLEPQVVEVLVRLWSTVHHGPGSAAWILRTAAEQEAAQGEPLTLPRLIDA